MNKSNSRRAMLTVWVAAGAALLSVAGCDNTAAGGDRTVSPEEAKRGQAQRQQMVLDNPNMPPQARAAAMGAMRQGQASGEQSGKSQKENLAKSPPTPPKK